MSVSSWEGDDLVANATWQVLLYQLWKDGLNGHVMENIFQRSQMANSMCQFNWANLFPD